MIGRRQLLSGLAGGGLALGLTTQAGARDQIVTRGPPTGRFEALEARSGGRLGVSVVDLESGRTLAYRARQRFPMCSTFKFPLVAVILQRVDQGRENLGRELRVKVSDLVNNSPVVEKRVGGSMTIAELCEAAITQSDNAAANLLLAQVGGPQGFTAALRALGDPTTRLDRWETLMSESDPSDPRDTTSPLAMTDNLRRLLLGNVLSLGSRERLTDWMVANRTGGRVIRAGVPANWRVGDKTGTGNHGARNDVAILWPPGRKPILVAAYLTGSKLKARGRDEVLAEVGRIVAAGV